MSTASKMRNHGMGLLALLLLQFVLGMLTNLFVSFPETNDGYKQWDYARSHILVIAHIALGMLLLIGTIVLFVRAVRARDRNWKIASGLGLGSVILAIMSGSEFISSQNDALSFAMAMFFVVALVSLGWGVYKSKT